MLIEDIRGSYSLFTQLHYSHVNREYKKVAHSLAKYAMHILDFLVWMEDVPQQFLFVIQADLAGFS